MNIFKIFKMVFFLFFGMTLCAQEEINEASFRRNIDFLMKDAATGFQVSRGEYKSRDFMGTRYDCLYRLFEMGVSEIVYNPEQYYKHARETMPEVYYFAQGFETDKPEGAILAINGERTFDEIAAAQGLKKVAKKYKKKDRDNYRNIEYLDKNGRRVLYFYSSIKNRIAMIEVHSDLRPADLPKYVGCLVLYNVQGQSLVSAIALYVYGDGFESEAKLYSNALSKMTGSGASYYKQYEFFPGGRVRDVEAKLDQLGITYTSERINPDGYGIK
ncbi:hypothetical protein [Flavobacterium sp.]|uniref:hypothetical protein n=1 Tax=Flavobacterium sp. TaxID=239 RepID=UPI0040337719